MDNISKHWQKTLILLAKFILNLHTIDCSMPRCALPMTLTKSIAFQTATGVFDEHNITEYTFDDLDCHCTGYVNNRFIAATETYMCRTGNILNVTSQIFASDRINIDIGRIICKLDEKQKTVVPKSYLTFACKDTENVQPSTTFDNDNQTIVIKPISFYRSGGENLKEWHDLIHAKPEFRLWFPGDYGFEHFGCLWRACSGLIIFPTESALSLNQIERGKQLNNLLNGILEKKVLEPANLEITEANLPVLPEAICQYRKLQRLALVNSQLKEIPWCLHNMNMLRFLDVSFNAISSVDEVTFGPGLHPIYLDLSFNQIAQIKQNAFSKLSLLFFLSVRNNSLTEINFHLPPKHLIYLDISYNNINSIQTNVTSLSRLTTLILKHNEIKQIDFKIPPKLNILDLSYNRIESISKFIFENAAGLTTLTLKNNKLKTIEFSWRHIPDAVLSPMEAVVLKNNLIENLDETLFKRKPKLLDLSYNRVKILNLSVLQNATNLQTLRLDHNNINEIKDDIINGTGVIDFLPNMNYMNLSFNQLKVVPLGLIFLNMHTIDFSHNHIKRCTWSNMPYEHILRYIDQKIISSCVERYNYLKEHKRENRRNLILLNNNRIRYLKDVFGHISVMVHRYATLFCHVHLVDNPFHCDCQAYPILRALHDFIAHTGQNMAEDIDKIIISKESAHQILYPWNDNRYHSCESPAKMKSYSLLDKETMQHLTCSLLPQEKCQFLYQPSSHLLHVNCSNLKMKTMPLFNASLLSNLNESAVNHHVPEGLKVNVYLNGNDFDNTIVQHSQEIFLIDLVQQAIKGKIEILDLSLSNLADIDILLSEHLSKKLPHLTHLYLNGNNITKLPLNDDIYTPPKEASCKEPPSGKPEVSSRSVVEYGRDQAISIPYKLSRFTTTDEVDEFLKRLTELHLYDNPWDCSCSAAWMKKLLNELISRKILVRPDEIKCMTPEWNKGKMVYIVDYQDFCVEPKSIHDKETSLISVQSTAIIIAATLILFVYLWKFMRFENEIQMHVPPTRDAIVDDDDITDMEYDVFMSYCEPDSDWVEGELIPSLQQHDPPYKVCQHKRHFLPGMTSEWNEFNAIRHSRRTVIVMSNEYLAREHCEYEFTAAYYYWIKTKKNPRLVVVKYPDVEIENQNETCSAYFRKYTYLAKDGDTFDRLLAFMPREGLPPNVVVNDNVGNPLFLRDENFTLRLDEGLNEQGADSHEEEPHNEDAIYEQMWQVAELEAAERTEAGDNVLAEEIFINMIENHERFHN